MNKTELQNYPDELIFAYLKGELDPSQEKSLKEWVAKDASHKKYFYEMNDLWLSMAALTEDVGKEEACNRFIDRLDQVRKPKRFSLYAPFVRTVAAVFLGVMLLGGTFWLGNGYGRQQGVELSHLVEVPLGSRSRIVLPDNTVVWLNAGSKLTYSNGFSQTGRTVNLEGEGYFEVVRNPELPFIVNTSHVDVQVFGTKFGVKAYGDAEEIEVVLAEGSVQFINKSDPAASFMMKPEELAVLNKKTGQVEVCHVSPASASDWTTGAHFFNELSFGQIAGALEKSFDVTIVFRNPEKASLQFYGDFSSNDTLDDILTVLASSGKFKYRKTRNIIEVY